MIRADRGADLCIISIHTPTKGATGDKQELYEDVYKFQSTLPRRERLYLAFVSTVWMRISIHTPTKGATAMQNGATLDVVISIHTPTKGAT